MTAALAVDVCSCGPCKLVLDTSGSEEHANLMLSLSITLPIAQLQILLQKTPQTRTAMNDESDNSPDANQKTLCGILPHGGRATKLLQSTCNPATQLHGPFIKVEQTLVQPSAPQVGEKFDNSQKLVQEEHKPTPETNPYHPQQQTPRLANADESNGHQLASSQNVKPDHQVKISESKSSQLNSAGLKQAPTRAPFPLLGPGLPADFDPSKALEALEALQAQSLPQQKPTHQVLKLTKPTGTTITRTSVNSGQAVIGKAPAAPASCPAPGATVARVVQKSPASGLPQMFQMFQFQSAPSLPSMPTLMDDDGTSEAQLVQAAGLKPATQSLPLGSLDFEEVKHAPLVHTREQPSLNLNGYGIQELTSVASSIRSTPSLTELHLSYNMIKDVTPIAVLLSTDKKLETLHLSGNQIKDLSPLAQALSMNETLKHLYLSSNGISDVGPLLVLKSNAGLQRLDLSCNVINKIEPLATALESNSCLSTLLLSGNKIEDICQLCVSMCRNNTLQVLRLNGNKIKDANDLADMLRTNKTLRKVDLGGNFIKDFVELAEAVPGNGHLEEVVLSRNPGVNHGCIREHLARDRRIVL